MHTRTYTLSHAYDVYFSRALLAHDTDTHTHTDTLKLCLARTHTYAHIHTHSNNPYTLTFSAKIHSQQTCTPAPTFTQTVDYCLGQRQMQAKGSLQASIQPTMEGVEGKIQADGKEGNSQAASGGERQTQSGRQVQWTSGCLDLESLHRPNFRNFKSSTARTEHKSISNPHSECGKVHCLTF